VIHQPVSRDLAVFAGAWLSGWLAEITADLCEAVAHQRRFATMRYINPRTLVYFTFYAIERCPSVCPSVRPLHAGIVSKRLNISTNIVHRGVATPY